MGNNIVVAITADVADLQVKRTLLSAELKALNKDLSDFAKQATSSGMTAELRQGMLETADGVVRVKNEIGGLDRQIRNLAASASAETKASTAAIAEQAAAVEKARLLNPDDLGALRVRMALTKQMFGEEAAAEAAAAKEAADITAFRMQLTKQRAVEEAAANIAAAKAGQAAEAAAAKEAAGIADFRMRLAKQRAAEEAAASAATAKAEQAASVATAKAEQAAEAAAAKDAAGITAFRMQLTKQRAAEEMAASAATAKAEQAAEAAAAKEAANIAAFRLQLAKQRAAEEMAANTAKIKAEQTAEAAAAKEVAGIADFRMRLAKQRAAEEAAASAATAKAEQASQADAAKEAAAIADFRIRMTKQRVAEEAAADAGAAKAAKQAAQEAEDLAQRRERLLAATSPLARAEHARNATVAEANTLLKAGTLTHAEHAAAVAASEEAYKKAGKAISNLAHEGMNSRAVFETLVLVHEALRGSFTRMASSSMILGQALAGPEKTAKLLNAVMSPLGLTIAAVGVAAVATAVLFYEYAEAQHELEVSTVGLGAASGVTAGQLNDLATRGLLNFKSSIGDNQKALEAFTAAGVRNIATLENLKSTVADFAALTGQKTAPAVKELADAMRDPIKGSQELNEKLSFLDATQLRHIQTLVELGQKEEAQAEISRLLKENDDKAAAAVGGLTDIFHQAGAAAGNMANYVGELAGELAKLALFGEAGVALDLFSHQGSQQDKAAAFQRQAQDKKDSAKAKPLQDATPEAKAESERNKLQGDVTVAQKGLEADIRLHGERSEAVKRDRESLAEYQRAFKSYLTDAEKAHRIAELDAQIAEARHKHNAQLVEDLTKQRELTNLSGQVMSPQEAQQRAADAAALAGARTHEPKGSSPSQVSVWADQLRQQEVAEKNFFGDRTQTELDFWNKKKALVGGNAKELIAINDKIYELEKKKAHDQYEDKLADLNVSLEADRDNWSNEQADWTKKLNLIKEKFTDQGKEYKDAYREFETAEREHKQHMLQIERETAQEQINELRQTLQTNAEIRDRNASTAQAGLRTRAQNSGNPLAEVNAEKQIAAMNRQAAQQKIADLRTTYAVEDQLRKKAVDDAKVAAGPGADLTQVESYKKAVEAKHAADVQYFNQKRNLENQATNQAIQDQQRIQQAWHAQIDPMVQTVGAQMKGLINGTENWAQALRNIGLALEDMVIKAIEKVVENWIVAQITGQASQAATAQTGVMAAAALAGANGVASMAGAPFPLDLGAPGFGASMAATAAGFGLAGFDKGMDVVPQDMIAQIHQGERIVPRADNAALIQAARGGGGGTTNHITNNLNHAPVINGAPQGGVLRQLESNKREFARLLKTMARDGHFKAA